MKKNLRIILIVVVLYILFTPIPIKNVDSTIVEYKSIVYSIKKYKTINSNKNFSIEVFGKTIYSKPKPLTLDDVVELSKKGNNLTFDDFDEYLYTDIGFGLKVEQFNINKNYYLLVGGTSNTPFYITLNYTKNASVDSFANESDTKKIDIRENNVEDFIRNNK